MWVDKCLKVSRFYFTFIYFLSPTHAWFSLSLSLSLAETKPLIMLPLLYTCLLSKNTSIKVLLHKQLQLHEHMEYKYLKSVSRIYKISVAVINLDFVLNDVNFL